MTDEQLAEIERVAEQARLEQRDECPGEANVALPAHVDDLIAEVKRLRSENALLHGKSVPVSVAAPKSGDVLHITGDGVAFDKP